MHPIKAVNNNQSIMEWTYGIVVQHRFALVLGIKDPSCRIACPVAAYKFTCHLNILKHT